MQNGGIRVIAFKVEIDGQQAAVAGVDDWSVLTLNIAAGRAENMTFSRPQVDEIRLDFGGLTQDDASGIRHHFRWRGRDLSIGSKVGVTIVESDHPDPPLKRYRSDAEVQESPFTEEELEAMDRKYYLELKREFES